MRPIHVKDGLVEALVFRNAQGRIGREVFIGNLTQAMQRMKTREIHPCWQRTNLDGLAVWMLKGPNGNERVELAFKERLQSGGASRKRHARADTRALPQKQGETGTHELVFGRWCPMSINAALTHNT